MQLSRVTLVIFLVFLLSIVAFAQTVDHRDTVIHYIACDRDIAQPIAEDNPLVVTRKWAATWNGNGFQHTPGPGVEGTAHPDTIMRYLTWDGTCWEASWNPTSKKFIHKNVGSGSVHEDTILNYLTWDRTKWTTIRDGNGFYHFWAGEAEWEESDFSVFWRGVREFFQHSGDNVYSTPAGSSSGTGLVLVTTMCAGPIPKGWIKSNDSWNPNSCPNGGGGRSITYNEYTITRYDNIPKGSAIVVCSGPVPSGWKMTREEWDPQSCGHPKSGKNRMTIQRVN